MLVAMAVALMVMAPALLITGLRLPCDDLRLICTLLVARMADAVVVGHEGK